MRSAVSATVSSALTAASRLLMFISIQWKLIRSLSIIIVTNIYMKLVLSGQLYLCVLFYAPFSSALK